MSFFEGPHGRVPYRFWPARRPLAGFIFLHGGGDDSHRYHRLAMMLNERQISVLATNGLGENLRRSPRAGLSSLDVLVGNLGSLAALAAGQLPGTPLVVGGHSLGGTTAALAVVRDADPFAGLVLSGAPLAPLRRIAVLAQDDPVSLDLSYLYAVNGGPAGLARSVPVVEVKALNEAWAELAERFEKVRLPVLFVHGGNDALVPITDNRAWAARLHQGHLAWFPRARHDVLNASGHLRSATAVADFVLSVALSRAVA